MPSSKGAYTHAARVPASLPHTRPQSTPAETSVLARAHNVAAKPRDLFVRYFQLTQKFDGLVARAPAVPVLVPRSKKRRAFPKSRVRGHAIGEGPLTGSTTAKCTIGRTQPAGKGRPGALSPARASRIQADHHLDRARHAAGARSRRSRAGTALRPPACHRPTARRPNRSARGGSLHRRKLSTAASC